MAFDDSMMMDRRLLLQRALVLVGSTMVLGACATLPDAAVAAEPFALTPAQSATLTALADTIIPVTDTPGAVAAGVPAQVEQMMAHWAAPANRTEMLAALGRIEVLGGGFSALSPERRYELLHPHDAAALVVTAAPAGDLVAQMAGPKRADQGYASLRELVITLYYYSEIALTQELEWVQIPGRWDPSVPLTANSHATSSGISSF